MSTRATPDEATGAPLTQKGRPVPQTKLDKVHHLAELLEQYEYICLIRTEQIGSKQFQQIKKALREQEILIHMAKNTLMLRALEIAARKRKRLGALSAYIEGSCAFAFTNISPFQLNNLLLQNKAKAPAKAGSVTPKDIVITKGNTGFPPGPLISELGQVGLKTRVQGGSIWITADHVMVKEGDTVTRAQALVLSRLGIEPYEIYLRISAAYDDGTILKADIFEITLGDLLGQFREAAQAGLALALATDLVIPETLTSLLQRAHTETRSLILSISFPAPEMVPDLLARAAQQAVSLAHAVKTKDPNALPN